MLPREPYLPPAGEDKTQWLGGTGYMDGGLTRSEILKTSAESDAYFDFEQRVSPDNGRSWSEPEVIEGATRQLPGGGIVTYPGRYYYDTASGLLCRPQMRRLWPGEKLYTFNWGSHEHTFNDHTFVVENDTVEKMMRYEEGPEFDPEDPFSPAFCATNRAYLGVGMAFAEDGTAYFPLVCYRPGEQYRRNEAGVVLMRRDPATGDWRPSTQQCVSPQVSSRGLLEPDVAVLNDGNLLVVCRGSNTETMPGRKWMSVSADGGRTLSPVEEFRYDDGSSFYSPSSIHSFVRSSRNGKLYWLANIVEEPPSGNGPRYPLYIAEIDEDKVAVRKGSLVVVDTRREGDPEAVQLSNFSVLENRETLDVEIYMTRLGENAEHFWQAGVYRYTFAPPA